MDIDVKAWLYDMLNAINEIEGFFIDIPKDFDHYKNDLRTKRAVERNIEIIGEAMNRILKKDDSFKISNSRKLVVSGHCKNTDKVHNRANDKERKN